MIWSCLGHLNTNRPIGCLMSDQMSQTILTVAIDDLLLQLMGIAGIYYKGLDANYPRCLR